ncbi:MAG: hypothetical protein SA339_00160 [Methanomassiliicoccus sp.]|nr:hypothetical protein [Methanomassiliicoccus sp.]
MEDKSVLLKPMGAWYALGGLITIVSAIVVSFIDFRLGAVLAIPAFILLALLGSMEFSAGRTIWRSEVGSWRSIMTASLVTVVARLLFVFLLWPEVFTGSGTVLFWESDSKGAWLLYLNLIWLAVEAVLSIYLYLHSDLFMREEREGDRPDLASCRVKSASECPHCHEVVETYWRSCPCCGTKLPRVCRECGGEIGDMMARCPQCGAEIMQAASMAKTVEMCHKLTQENDLPETKAGHYARLAEALLKNGQPEEAVIAYRHAIALTSFPRKRTNFMVRAARILINTGHQPEAAMLLDEALAIDPEDIAGAQMVRSEMGRPSFA